jgi:hypothetical protein
LYYVFEGLSVLGNNQFGGLDDAAKQLEGLQANNLNFFVSGDLSPPDVALMRHFRFGPTRFFLDPSRVRKLCVERRATVVDRKQFADALNELVCGSLNRGLGGQTEEQILAMIEQEKKAALDQNNLEIARAGGAGPLLKALQGLADIAGQFDKDSVGRIRDRADAGFAWLRFEPETVRVVVPVTAACARNVVRDPATKG